MIVYRNRLADSQTTKAPRLLVVSPFNFLSQSAAADSISAASFCHSFEKFRRWAGSVSFIGAPKMRTDGMRPSCSGVFL